jgi:Sulfotransferase domain
VPLEIIGAGVGRTGTTSLKLALEQLGFGPCLHMTELITHPEQGALWRKVAEGGRDWDGVFAGYRSTTDYPGCLFWRELAAYYPAAKVILTVRDPEAWFQSTQATIFAPGRPEPPPEFPMSAAFTLIHSLHRDTHDHDAMLADFARHNAAVIGAIPKNRLLVYDVAEGWAPLATFLGVPVPEAPFPRANTRDDFTAGMAQMAASGGAPDPDRIREFVAARLLKRERGATE